MILGVERQQPRPHVSALIMDAGGDEDDDADGEVVKRFSNRAGHGMAAKAMKAGTGPPRHWFG